MNLIVEGDRHIQSKEPFLRAHQAYNDWILSQPWNNEETVFFSEGDFFHKQNPDPKEYGVAVNFIERSKFKHIYIQAGNHEYSRPKNRWALHPLEHFDNVTVLYTETFFSIENTNFLSLPFYYPNTRPDVGKMEEYYPTIGEQFKDRIDYLFGHLYFVDTFGSFVDVSGIEAKHRIFGHDHIQMSNEVGTYIGTPMPHRYSEKGQQGRLLKIDCETTKSEWVTIPKILDYADVTYPGPLPESDAEFTIWDIHEAPNKQVAIEHYGSKNPNFAYRDVKVHRDEAAATDFDEENGETWTIMDWLNRFFTQNEKSEAVQKIVKGKLASQQ